MKATSRTTEAYRKLYKSDPTQFTPCFEYEAGERSRSQRRVRAQQLHCEGVALEKIAEAIGTPTYVYSSKSIEAAYGRLDRALGSLPHTLCYAVKANSNLSVLRVLARLGSSFDVVSGGELDRLRRLAVPGRRIVFSGVGKSREEIRQALRYPGTTKHRDGILLFNIESAAELEVFEGEASRHVNSGGKPASAAIRINPDVAAGGHPHISTGRYQHKFGMEWYEARRLYLARKNSPWFAWSGISAHIGSQILAVAPFQRALARVAACVRELARDGIRLSCVDIGGGLGITYTNERAPSPTEYGRALARIVRPLKCRLLLEPGRAIVGPAGVLLTRVLYVKETRGKKFVIVDAAMNDLIRPALYGATHAITKTARIAADRRKEEPVDVVGPVCETGDFLARDWPLEPVESGDLLAVWTAGAYGFAESSNYNARPRAAEVLVEGGRFWVVRRRETYEDLVRGER
jgi:diaminopimelate decarboxylase